MSHPARVFVTLVLAVFVGALPLHAALDSTLFTNYTLSNGDTNLFLVVCGSLPGSDGCYGSANLGPFGKVGAILEGYPSIAVGKGTVTRLIYVLDVAAGAKGNQVTLDIFKKVDTISGSSDTVTVTAYKTITLPLTGSSSTVASMAANHNFIYVGTNKDQQAVQLKKTTLAITQFSVISGPETVSSITANQYGFVTVTWGPGGGPNGFETIDPNGNPTEEGGGANFTVNPIQASLPAALP